MVLKLVSAVSSRREVSKLFNRVAIMILLYSSAKGAGIGIYNGLFHSTAITHSFNLFIDIIGVITSFTSAYSFSLAVTPVGPRPDGASPPGLAKNLNPGALRGLPPEAPAPRGLIELLGFQTRNLHL
jgi:hypothetical protein